MNLLEMSFAGSVMVLAILIIRALAINRLPKRTFLILWGIAAARLLLPLSIPSPFSVYSVLDGQPLGTAATDVPQAAGTLPAGAVEPVATAPPSAGGGFAAWWSIWAVGAVVCALVFAIAYWNCRRAFRFSLPVENDFVRNWLRDHLLRRSISIRQSGRFSTPLTYGVFRPVILMPDSAKWEDAKPLQYVLAHEYIHIRRFDAVAKFVLIAAGCVHWFNPLVWLMYLLANRDIELSCDEAVVRLFGENKRADYARTLIGMEEARSGFAPLCSSFSKNAIEERITAIMKVKRASIWAACIAVILVAGFTTVLATSRDTKADYEPIDGRPMLEALMVEGYQDQTVSEFNNALSEWRSQHPVKNDDMRWRYGDVTEEESNFIWTTLKASLLPQLRFSYGQDLVGKGVKNLSVELAYGIAYQCDPDTVTVGERDTVISNVVNDIHSFWYGTDIEVLAEMTSDEVRSKVDEIIARDNTDKVTISIVEEYFECKTPATRHWF